MEARLAFRMLAGINGRIQVVNPTNNVLFVRTQNIRVPQMRFSIFPRKMPIQDWYFCLERSSVPSPMMYAMIGKESIKPPVGPTMDCQPPVKFAKTGNPIKPTSIYINVERAPLREPRTIPARATAKDCIVIGTPNGIGKEICAIIARTAEKSPTRHRSCIFNLFCFIDSLRF